MYQASLWRNTLGLSSISPFSGVSTMPRLYGVLTVS